MKSNVERMTEDLKKVLFSNVYSFEIETKDIVFGFSKVLKKRTKSLAKAIALEQKLRNNVGRYLSSTLLQFQQLVLQICELVFDACSLQLNVIVFIDFRLQSLFCLSILLC